MTDETLKPKPKRKRRRWIIAGVLLLVSLVSWWYWPRGDARFVGKWVMSVVGQPPAVMTLSANGMGTSVIPGVARSTFPWRVSGDRLHYGWKCSGFALPTASRLTSSWFALTGTLHAVGEENLELTNISHESISFRRPALAGPAPTPADEVITMTRIHE